MQHSETGAMKTGQRSYPMALPGSADRQPGPSVWRFFPLLAVVVAYPLVLNDNLALRILFAVTLFLAVYINRRSAALPVMVIVYLAVMGGVRRNLIPLLGEQPRDPLLIVVPLVAVLMGLGIVFSRRVPYKKRYERLMLVILLYMAVEIFNPNQGPIIVGIAGCLFYVVPLIWYYIGRELGTERTMRWVLNTILVVGILGALYGIKQGIYGLTPAEQEWLTVTAYNSVYISNVDLRPFSFFTSTVEYASFLTLAIVVAWSMTIRGRPLAFCVIPLLCWALFYTGIRTPIVVTLASCVLVWAVQGRSIRSWLPRGALAVVLATGGLVYALIHAQDSNSAIVQHQTGGLLNPGDSRRSTAGAHAALAGIGLKEGIMKPQGMGLGYTTLAESKFGPGGFSTEIDVTNLFISLGAPGGSLYLFLVIILLIRAFRYWHRARTTTALAMLGILFAHLGNWLDGGSYAVAMVIWFCIGAIDYGFKQNPQWERAA